MATLVFENKDLWERAAALVDELHAEGHHPQLLQSEDLPLDEALQSLQAKLGKAELLIFVGLSPGSIATAQVAGLLTIRFDATKTVTELRESLQELLQ